MEPERDSQPWYDEPGFGGVGDLANPGETPFGGLDGVVQGEPQNTAMDQDSILSLSTSKYLCLFNSTM